MITHKQLLEAWDRAVKSWKDHRPVRWIDEQMIAQNFATLPEDEAQGYTPRKADGGYRPYVRFVSPTGETTNSHRDFRLSAGIDESRD